MIRNTVQGEALKVNQRQTETFNSKNNSLRALASRSNYADENEPGHFFTLNDLTNQFYNE